MDYLLSPANANVEALPYLGVIMPIMICVCKRRGLAGRTLDSEGNALCLYRAAEHNFTGAVRADYDGIHCGDEVGADAIR